MEILGQFDKQRIAKVVGEIQRQKNAKRDFVYPVNRLAVSEAGELLFSGHDKGFQVNDRSFVEWSDAEQYLDFSRSKEMDGSDDWSIKVVDGSPGIPLSKKATSQLLGRLGIPALFANKLRDGGNADLLKNLQCGLMDRKKGSFLVRTLDGIGRAVLSDHYRILDNADVFFAAAEKLQNVNAEILDARIWDGGFEMFAAASHISGEVTSVRPGGRSGSWDGAAGDVHNPAVRISNSETGEGGLNVSVSVLRMICSNFFAFGDLLSQIHSGKRIEAGNGNLIISDETRQKEGDLIWSQVRDAVTTAFDEKKFQELINKLDSTTKDAIDEPSEAVDNVLAKYDISEDRKRSVLEQLLSSGDRSRFGLIQAVTHQAHHLYESNPAEASKLETIGGKVANMTSTEFYKAVAV